MTLTQVINGDGEITQLQLDVDVDENPTNFPLVQGFALPVVFKAHTRGGSITMSEADALSDESILTVGEMGAKNPIQLRGIDR